MPEPGKSKPMTRRFFLAAGGTLAAAAVLFKLRPSGAADTRAENAAHFEVMHSDAEWRALLSPEAYAVLRQQATELPFSSPLDHEKRHGVFACAGCALDLYS